MKLLAAVLLVPLAFANFAIASKADQPIVQNSGRIIAESIPECLHIGDVVEALVWVDSSTPENAFDLVINSEMDLVSTTLKLANGLNSPVAVIVRGEKFGEDIVTLSVPGRPDIAPLKANIRVLASFEPPLVLSTHPTEKFSYYSSDPEGEPIKREVFFEWRPIKGVEDYRIDVFNSEMRIENGTSYSADGNSVMMLILPDERHFWRIQAGVETCTGGKIWTFYSPFIPFDA